MAMCKVCGNEYAHAFEVVRDGHSNIYDCFECAIHDMAPTCAHCQCRVIGHGIAAGEAVYCCAHCAREQDVIGVADKVGQAPRPQHAPFI